MASRSGFPLTCSRIKRVLAVVAVAAIATPVAGLCGAPSTSASASPTFSWPNGARAAVSIGYDDALNSQLDRALPVLNRFGIKGSFYLQLSNPSVAQRMADWRAAAQAGHELGNHTLFHQCAGSAPDRAWVAPHRNLDTASVEQMRDQVLLANTMLEAIDGRKERTFTVPCGDTVAAGRDYLPTVRASFVAVKVGSGVIETMDTLNPLAVPGTAPVGVTGQQLIASVQRAAEQGTMVNFTFHGIGGDYLSVSAEAHEELVRFLANNRQLVWTDTFINIMKHVRQEQARARDADITKNDVFRVVRVAQHFARNLGDINLETLKMAFPGTYRASDCGAQDAFCGYVNMEDTSELMLSNIFLANKRKPPAFGGGALVWELPRKAPCLHREDLDGLLGQPGQRPDMPPTAMSFDNEPLFQTYLVYKQRNSDYPKVAIGGWLEKDCVVRIELDAKILPAVAP